jgi:hypothetical protein
VRSTEDLTPLLAPPDTVDPLLRAMNARALASRLRPGLRKQLLGAALTCSGWREWQADEQVLDGAPELATHDDLRAELEGVRWIWFPTDAGDIEVREYTAEEYARAEDLATVGGVLNVFRRELALFAMIASYSGGKRLIEGDGAQLTERDRELLEHLRPWDISLAVRAADALTGLGEADLKKLGCEYPSNGGYLGSGVSTGSVDTLENSTAPCAGTSAPSLMTVE